MRDSGDDSITVVDTKILEWHVSESDDEWQDDLSQPTLDLASDRLRRRRVHIFFLVTLLLAAMVGGWWTWNRANAGLATVVTEVENEVVAELWREHAPSTQVTAAASDSLNANGPKTTDFSHDPQEVVTHVAVRDLGDDWAVVDVTLQPAPNGPSFRQTRVYREDIQGWTRSLPVTEQWGALRTHESDYFVFHYYELDEEAVLQAAPRLDMFYTELRHSPWMRPVAEVKREVLVDPAREAGMLDQEEETETRLAVASPAMTLAPVDLPPADLLLQSLMLALYDRRTTETSVQSDLSSTTFRLRNAQRLWFIWKNELPLAAWREPLVQWMLDGPNQGGMDVPAFAGELCDYHRLWMPAPLEVAVPILCWRNNDGERMLTAWDFHQPVEEIKLTTLIYHANVSPEESTMLYDMPLPEPGPGAILLATVFEYVEATYGPGRMPLLLAAIPEHQRAETLIPAVFGVPSEVFTEEWHAFLAERY